MIRFISEVLALMVSVIIIIAVVSILTKDFRTARTKTGVELLLDCLPKMEKASFKTVVSYLIELVFFSGPALIMHGIISSLHFGVVRGVRLWDAYMGQEKNQ